MKRSSYVPLYAPPFVEEISGRKYTYVYPFISTLKNPGRINQRLRKLVIQWKQNGKNENRTERKTVSACVALTLTTRYIKCFMY